MGRRTFIDDLVEKSNSPTRDCHQETPIRRILVDLGVLASGSLVENTRAAATSSNIPAEEDKVGTTGSADRSPIYHIYRKVVTE